MAKGNKPAAKPVVKKVVEQPVVKVPVESVPEPEVIVRKPVASSPAKKQYEDGSRDNYYHVVVK